MAKDSDSEKREGWTWRDWVKLGLVIGGSAAAGTVGVGLAGTLRRSPPPEQTKGPILYTRFPHGPVVEQFRRESGQGHRLSGMARSHRRLGRYVREREVGRGDRLPGSRHSRETG